jgi:hypothetical protein
VSGRICFAALDGRSKILARTQAAVLKSSEAEDAVLEMPNLKDAKSIVVFNEGDVPGKVEILDARILVAPQDWEQNKAVYAPLR